MPAVSKRELDINGNLTVCPECAKRKKHGVLHNVTSRLAEAMGVMHLECDVCHQKWAVKVTQEAK